jgi:parallel beta-helix repeat protein
MQSKARLSLFLLILIIAASLPGYAIPQAHATVVQTRPPIIIVGNQGFTAANGVVAGSGTALDPYIIQGWEIDGGQGMFLLNTEAFVIIRNVYVHSSYSGIDLYNVHNVRVENVTLTDNGSGVRMEYSASIVVNGSRISYTHGSEDDGGITVLESKGISITNNVLSSNARWGLRVSYSEVSVYGNTIESSLRNGIETLGSNVTITNNDIQSNYERFGVGVELGCITRAIISGNRLRNNGLFIDCDSELLQHGMRMITPDNTVNGKPLLYYEGCGDLHFDRTPIGQLIVAGCNSLAINHVTMDQRGSGIFAAFVNNLSVRNSRFTNEGSLGIIGVQSSVAITSSEFSNSTSGSFYIGGAKDVTFEGNVVQFNNGAGLDGIAISHGRLSGNTFRGNGYGLFLSDSQDITISSNQIVSNTLAGVFLYTVSNSIISHNRVLGNHGPGIDLEFSANITFMENSFVANAKSGLRLYSSILTTVIKNHFTGDGISMDFRGAPHNVVMPDNTLNGNPILYYETCPTGFQVSNTALGQLVIANCHDVQIFGLRITGAYEGIQLLTVSNVKLAEVDVSTGWSGIHTIGSNNVQVIDSILHSNTNGILVDDSPSVSIENSTITQNFGAGISDNYSAALTITGNLISGNGYGVSIGTLCCSSFGDKIVGNQIEKNNIGVFIDTTCCSPNMVYHNNFVENKFQMSEDSSFGPTPMYDNGYPSGGNYWSDYKGVDNCSGPGQDVCPGPDGIGDTPYIIDSLRVDRYPLMKPLSLVIP